MDIQINVVDICHVISGNEYEIADVVYHGGTRDVLFGGWKLRWPEL